MNYFAAAACFEGRITWYVLRCASTAVEYFWMHHRCDRNSDIFPELSHATYIDFMYMSTVLVINIITTN